MGPGLDFDSIAHVKEGVIVLKKCRWCSVWYKIVKNKNQTYYFLHQVSTLLHTQKKILPPNALGE